MKMKQSIKAKWVAALRSGEYKQTTGLLRYDDTEGSSFCCLGVLCDIYREERGVGLWNDKVLEDEAAALPSGVVCKWAGFPYYETGQVSDPEVTLRDSKKHLSAHNDGGATFAEIADAIEEQL